MTTSWPQSFFEPRLTSYRTVQSSLQSSFYTYTSSRKLAQSVQSKRKGGCARNPWSSLHSQQRKAKQQTEPSKSKPQPGPATRGRIHSFRDIGSNPFLLTVL